MTRGNNVEVPTPGMPDTATGGVDPTAGKGNPAHTYMGGVLAMPQVGADAEAPAGTQSPGLDRYGVADDQAANQMQNMAGPGSTETTDATVNAMCSGNSSMQDMGGAQHGVAPKSKNTADGGSGLPSRYGQQGGVNTENDMASYE